MSTETTKDTNLDWIDRWLSGCSEFDFWNLLAQGKNPEECYDIIRKHTDVSVPLNCFDIIEGLSLLAWEAAEV